MSQATRKVPFLYKLASFRLVFGDLATLWMWADNGVAAMAALTRKKMLEKDLDKWTNTKNTIEQQVFALENANINLETMKAMKSGADAMKGIHGTLYDSPTAATR